MVFQSWKRPFEFYNNKPQLTCLLTLDSEQMDWSQEQLWQQWWRLVSSSPVKIGCIYCDRRAVFKSWSASFLFFQHDSLSACIVVVHETGYASLWRIHSSLPTNKILSTKWTCATMSCSSRGVVLPPASGKKEKTTSGVQVTWYKGMPLLDTRINPCLIQTRSKILDTNMY